MFVCRFAADANTKVALVTDIPDGWMGLDNGPASTKMIQAELADCKTIIWNGPSPQSVTPISLFKPNLKNFDAQSL